MNEPQDLLVQAFRRALHSLTADFRDQEMPESALVAALADAAVTQAHRDDDPAQTQAHLEALVVIANAAAETHQYRMRVEHPPTVTKLFRGEALTLAHGSYVLWSTSMVEDPTGVSGPSTLYVVRVDVEQDRAWRCDVHQFAGRVVREICIDTKRIQADVGTYWTDQLCPSKAQLEYLARQRLMTPAPLFPSTSP